MYVYMYIFMMGRVSLTLWIWGISIIRQKTQRKMHEGLSNRIQENYEHRQGQTNNEFRELKMRRQESMAMPHEHSRNTRSIT